MEGGAPPGTISVVRVPASLAPPPAMRSALARLLVELDPANPPELANLEGVLGDPATELLVALITQNGTEPDWVDVPDEAYVGMLTLGFRTTLTRRTAHIDHVVVDPARRRGGVGALLVREAMAVAAAAGASRIDLTSSARRTAAQELYRSMGFTRRDTVNWRRQL